jgi:hypothetical protein
MTAHRDRTQGNEPGIIFVIEKTNGTIEEAYAAADDNWTTTLGPIETIDRTPPCAETGAVMANSTICLST